MFPLPEMLISNLSLLLNKPSFLKVLSPLLSFLTLKLTYIPRDPQEAGDHIYYVPSSMPSTKDSAGP